MSFSLNLKAFYFIKESKTQQCATTEYFVTVAWKTTRKSCPVISRNFNTESANNCFQNHHKVIETIISFIFSTDTWEKWDRLSFSVVSVDTWILLGTWWTEKNGHRVQIPLSGGCLGRWLVFLSRSQELHESGFWTDLLQLAGECSILNYGKNYKPFFILESNYMTSTAEAVQMYFFLLIWGWFCRPISSKDICVKISAINM